ncbi:single-stranded-DNA-specific exonuclease RecJ [bacterium]|nr:single-stranded-DNA-specific exonuclease RecJ [bacterium]
MIEQPERSVIDHLTKALGVPFIIAKILASRRIESFEQARKFFRPRWEDTYDPFLMQDMDRAATRIIRAVEKNEKILVYGDYDVDGITAVSLLYLFLKGQGADIRYYIPNRMHEGYGLSALGIEKAVQAGAGLLITVDCGITAVEEVAEAGRRGIDVIISDHHEPTEQIPAAVAVLDPKRVDCRYPFKELAGVGVAFKLAQAVSQRLGRPPEACQDFTDLVALGSAADIVPLVDENRVLVSKGLEDINRLERVGINALAEKAALKGKKIGTGQLIFILAPRINAVGRLGNAERAVQLLVTESAEEAGKIAQVLEEENRNRKSLDEETFSEALALMETEFSEQSDRAVVLARNGWHSGVIGIVASRIVEQVYRPTIMIGVEEGIGKGSARSIPDFDIYSALKQCEQYLIGFGGHKYAAGLVISQEQIPAFREAFKQVAAETIRSEELIQKVHVDEEIELADITDKFIRLLNLFAPFGPQNMRPVFLSRNLQVVGTPQLVGRNHLKFKVRQGNHVYEAIGFNLGGLLYRLTPGEANLDMVYVIEENQWDGNTRIQLRVKDLV